VAKFPVTGMSGTGKSAVLRELATGDDRCVDTDSDACCEWVIGPDGRPDWQWREPAIRRLLADHRGVRSTDGA
jgi:hypothetical protein